jgi:hypothetical protein
MPLLRRPPAVLAVLGGGAAGAVLFMLYMVIYSGVRGVPACRILQAVASGVLGGAAFEAGGWTVALGALLHLLLVLAMAAAFYGAGALLRPLRRWPLLWGPLYGFGLYVLMYRVVLPYSAYPFPVAILPWSYFWANVAAHAGLGSLIALAAWWARRGPG